VSTQLSGITSDPQITATVNTVVNDATMNKLDQIEQQQIFIKKERDNVLTKITEGIGRLADKIVAKIEERQVINLDVTATVDEGVLFNTMTTKEVNGRQIPTVLSEEIGVQ
jgi:glutamate mutase epsilon subunit